MPPPTGPAPRPPTGSSPPQWPAPRPPTSIVIGSSVITIKVGDIIEFDPCNSKVNGNIIIRTGYDNISIDWLAYTAGLVTCTPLKSAVLSGPFSGCRFVRYRLGNSTYVAHIGTGTESFSFETIAVKQEWVKVYEEEKIQACWCYTPSRVPTISSNGPCPICIYGLMVNQDCYSLVMQRVTARTNEMTIRAIHLLSYINGDALLSAFQKEIADNAKKCEPNFKVDKKAMEKEKGRKKEKE